MQNISRVTFRKYTRRMALGRRNIVSIPERTVKYIHKSSTFATMMSDMGRERIGVYVQSMMHHNEVLAEMVNIGIISDRVLAAEVESISSESEKTEADLAMIRNALVRFIHTDSERIKSSRIPRGQSEKTRSPENELVAPDLPVPSLCESQNTALTVDDTLGY